MNIKHALIYLALTLFIILGSQYAYMLVFYINAGIAYTNAWLTPYLANDWLRKVLILLVGPIALVGLPALLYQLLKRKTMPYFKEGMWLIWMILTLCFLMNHKS